MLLGLAAALAGASNFGYFNAAALNDRCESNTPAEISYCFAYITGVHDTVRAYDTWLNQREFCVPLATPQADLRRTFVQYVHSHPGDVAGEAASVVVIALKESYPCRNGTAPAPTGPLPPIKPKR